MKSQSFKLDCFSTSMNGLNNSEDSSGTPKVTKEKQQYKPRHHRKISDIYTFTQRSSSIQSVRSTKNATKKKRLLAKKKTERINRMQKKEKAEGSERSDSSDSYLSCTESPRSAHLNNSDDKNASTMEQDIKLGKGKSSFAKKVDSKRVRKTKRKVRKFKTNKDSTKNNLKISGQAVSLNDKSKGLKFSAISGKKISMQLDQGDDKLDMTRVAKPTPLTSRFKSDKKLMNSEDFNKVTEHEKKRLTYQKKGRHNSTMQQAKTFMNVFNSFVGEESKSRTRSKKSSQLLQIKNSSSKDLCSQTRNYSFKRIKKYSKSKLPPLKIFQKNRSKSLKIGQRHQQCTLHRTLSDFHECLKAKTIIHTNLFTGRNIYEEIEQKFKVNKDNLSESMMRDSSVSDSDYEDSVQSEEEKTLVRFFSLPILPSEKESLEIQYEDEEMAKLHRYTNKTVKVSDFYLLRAVSHGAYGKVCLARKKDSRDLFAIKIMDKAKMEEKGVTEQVMNERNILNKIDNDYVVRGVYTFQTKKFLYIVMEYMMGGDFANLLEGIGAFDEETAKFYLAQI